VKPDSQLSNYWIWYIGSGVWLLDAAIALHLDHRSHALASIAVALLFLLAGALWRRVSNRTR
jgi:membrane-associated PAP2 superfamily phosphatase